MGVDGHEAQEEHSPSYYNDQEVFKIAEEVCTYIFVYVSYHKQCVHVHVDVCSCVFACICSYTKISVIYAFHPINVAFQSYKVKCVLFSLSHLFTCNHTINEVNFKVLLCIHVWSLELRALLQRQKMCVD